MVAADVGVDALQDEPRAHAAAFRRDAEIGLLHDRRGDHLGGIAVGDQPSVVQHDDAVGERAHDVHLVLDQQDGLRRVLLERAIRSRMHGNLVDAHAGGRLVEHEDFRLQRHHHRDLELALVAVRERGGALHRAARSGRPRSSTASARVDQIAARHPRPRHLVMHAGARLDREPDVLDHAQAGKEVGQLERAADARAARAAARSSR